MNNRGSGDKRFKVILVGDNNVGKSCLIFRYFKKRYPEEVLCATIGSCYYSEMFSHNGEPYFMDIWDTAGAERYRSITAQYYRKAAAVIVCFDLNQSNKKSAFENLHYWILSVLITEPLCKIYLCTTKSDLVSAPEIPKILEELDKIAGEYKTRTYVTSSKTGGDIDKLFEDIFHDYVRNLNSSIKNDSDLLTLQAGRLNLGERKKAICLC